MNGGVERKRLHAFNLIGFEAIRITIWPKRTKIAPIFFFGGGGESSTTLSLLPMLNFSVFFGAKRFRENSKSPEIISEKVRLGGRKHFFVWNFL